MSTSISEGNHDALDPSVAPIGNRPVELNDHDGGLWSSVLEALRGSRRNYTEGPIGRAILVLAIPMVLEMVMESVFAVCDVFFVSKLGAAAVATVGLTESLLALVYAVAMGLSIGASAMVARRTGERDHDGVARAATQAIILGLLVALGLGVVGATFAPSLLSAMGASSEVVAIGASYTRVMLGGNATVLLLFLINAIFRGAGDAAIAMRVLWLANAINIALGPCLIFGLGPFPELGVTGAAIATTIGRGTGALFAYSRLLRPGSRVDIHARHLRLEPPIMARLIRLSASGALQALIGMGSWIALIRVLSTFGSNALAGYTIGIRVIIFALLPAFGISNAAATMVGQNLGARRPDRAEDAVWTAALYNMIFLGAVGLVFLAGAPQIARFFTPDLEVQPYAVACLRIVSLGFLFYAYGMVLTSAFNGAGDTWTPTWINFGVFWLFEIPLAWVLAMHTRLGPRGVFWALTVAYSGLAVVSAILFRRGKWKARRI